METSPLDQADLDRLLQSPKQWPDYNNYQPLDHSRREIRLLKIWHERHRDEVYASVLHKSLEDEIEYDALSYYWGPPDEQKPIYIEGEPVLIRRSLHSFLNALCHHKQDLPVWLDSICINQRDVKERNSQVAMMGDIYQNAACVRAWIGETDADLEYSFAYLRNRDHQRLLDSEHFPEVVKRAKGSLRQVLSRPYWHRLWIIQEIGLAKKAVVLAGKRSVDLEELMNVVVDELDVGTFLHSLSKLRNQRGVLKTVRSTPQNDGLESSTIEISTLGDPWLSADTIFGRMSAFGTHLCEDPRDKIFGLISLCAERNSIEVDYRKTLGELVSQLLYALAKRHAEVFEYGRDPSYTLPLVHLQKMMEFAGRAATASSFEVDDLVDLKEFKGYEICCEIKSMEAEVYGRLTPGFSWNGELCRFRRWKNSSRSRRRSKLPNSHPKPLYDYITTDNDTNFYEIHYDRASNPQVCYYLGDCAPDPLRCRFFKISPMDSILSPTSPYAQHDVYIDQVMLLVEFEEEGPRVAGVWADAEWWDALFKPSDITGLPYYMSLVEVLAIFLLEGEIKMCSNVEIDERKSWFDGKLKLRLHCSRLACMIMLVAGPAGFTEASIREGLKDRQAVHPQSYLCGCQYEVEENAKIHQLVRETNIREIRDLLKRDARETQRELASSVGMFQMTVNAESWAYEADFPPDFNQGPYTDFFWLDAGSNENGIESGKCKEQLEDLTARAKSAENADTE